MGSDLQQHVVTEGKTLRTCVNAALKSDTGFTNYNATEEAILALPNSLCDHTMNWGADWEASKQLCAH